jgi:hypothetical protein
MESAAYSTPERRMRHSDGRHPAPDQATLSISCSCVANHAHVWCRACLTAECRRRGFLVKPTTISSRFPWEGHHETAGHAR